MPLRVTFSEQSTGIDTTMAGQWASGSVPYQRAEGMSEAMSVARDYLERHPDHEAWIGSSVSAHRLTLPVGRGFDGWIARFRQDSSLGSVCPGLNFAEIVSMLGWPDDCSGQFGKSPMAVILRYQPMDVDFHFDAGGGLTLIHQDDIDEPLTILSTADHRTDEGKP